MLSSVAFSTRHPIITGRIGNLIIARIQMTLLHVALWEPEIPPNTGNVARLCAATGAQLHLIGRLGFRLDDKSLRRAGVDYWSAITFPRHATFDEFQAAVLASQNARLFCFSAVG